MPTTVIHVAGDEVPADTLSLVSRDRDADYPDFAEWYDAVDPGDPLTVDYHPRESAS